MENSKDNAGVYFPPPLIHIIFFILSLWIQSYYPLSKDFIELELSRTLIILFFSIGLFFYFFAVKNFMLAKTTLLTMKPASSLRTDGVFSISRNPIYFAAFLFYLAFALLWGNIWTFIFAPFVQICVSVFIIKKEEAYLERKFGGEYLDYKSKVRRWI